MCGRYRNHVMWKSISGGRNHFSSSNWWYLHSPGNLSPKYILVVISRLSCNTIKKKCCKLDIPHLIQSINSHSHGKFNHPALLTHFTNSKGKGCPVIRGLPRINGKCRIKLQQKFLLTCSCILNNLSQPQHINKGTKLASKWVYYKFRIVRQV